MARYGISFSSGNLCSELMRFYCKDRVMCGIRGIHKFDAVSGVLLSVGIEFKRQVANIAKLNDAWIITTASDGSVR